MPPFSKSRKGLMRIPFRHFDVGKEILHGFVPASSLFLDCLNA